MRAEDRTLRNALVVAVALMGISSGPVRAMPANPALVSVKQKNGTVLQLVTRGDEYQGWQETTDGYTVVKNAKTGNYEYASVNAAGDLIPSGIVATPVRRTAMAAPGLRPPKGLRPRRNVELEQAQRDWIKHLRETRIALAFAPVVPVAGGAAAPPDITGTWTPRPVHGTKKLLVILVNFTGQPVSGDFQAKNAQLSGGAAAYWSNVVFGVNPNSVAAYYRDNSFGKITVSPVTHTQPGSPPGVITVSLPDPHPNYGNSFDYATETAWINRALAAAASFIDFAALDLNGDGTISVDEALIYFVIGGYETAAGSGLAPSIWAHRWGGDGVMVSNKKIDNWALNGEMYDASDRMQMGVIAHEMGHAMGGLPDLYDTSGTNAGLGAFSVMSEGSWGATANDKIPSTTPVGMDAWCRQYLGWSTPRYLGNGANVSFPAAQSGDPASAVLLMNPSKSTSEYWLVENRSPIKWDAGMYQLIGAWKGGLLIQHIDANIGTQDSNSFNTFVSGAHQGNVAVEPSGAKCNLLLPNAQSCPDILFAAPSANQFDAMSAPPSKYYSGDTSSVGVKDVSAADNTMTGTVEAVQ